MVIGAAYYIDRPIIRVQFTSKVIIYVLLGLLDQFIPSKESHSVHSLGKIITSSIYGISEKWSRVLGITAIWVATTDER